MTTGRPLDDAETSLDWRRVDEWDRVERGLDLLFKASTIRLLMLGLIAFLVLPPKTYNSASLLAHLHTFFYTIVAGTSVAIFFGVLALRQVRSAPRAVRSIRMAAIAAGLLSLVDVVRALDGFGLFGRGLLPDHLSAETYAIASHGLLAATMLLVLSGVTFQAGAAGALEIRRRAAFAQRVVVAMIGLYAVKLAVLWTWNPPERTPWLVLGAALMVALCVSAFFVLRPINHLALWIRRAADALARRGRAESEAAVVALDKVRALAGHGADHADVEDGEPWVPRRQAPTLGVVTGAPPKRLGEWRRAGVGLTRYLTGFAARVVVAFFGMLLVPGGESPYGIIAFCLIGALQVAATGLATSGLSRARAVPPATATRGLLTAAWALSLLTLVFELAYLALGIVSVTAGPLALTWPLLTTVMYALGLFTMAFVAVSMTRLAYALRQPSAARWVSAIYGCVTLLLGSLLALIYFDAHPDREVQTFGIWVGIGATFILLTVVVMYLHTVNATAEAIDDRVVRIEHQLTGRI